MLKDPLTRWHGPFPYDVLERVGITPAASLRQVLDASFALMEQGGMTPEARQAWDELRLVPRRLLVDFFLYSLDPAAEIARARRALEAEIATWWNEP
jgi:hypothetical protein